VGYTFKVMQTALVFLRWENSQIRCQGSCSEALYIAEAWFNEVGLSVNPDKTEPIIFTRKRKRPHFFEPHFFWVTFSRSMSVKNLAVILDFRLTWTEHVDVTVRKAHNLLCARGVV